MNSGKGPFKQNGQCGFWTQFALRVENSPALERWDSSPTNIQSPVRDETPLRTATTFSAVPRGTFSIWLTHYPAMNGWAIVIASLRDRQTSLASIVHPKMNA